MKIFSTALPNDKTDEELWHEMKQGSRDALEEIFRRYYANLYQYGIKLTGNSERVEDQIQELFIKIWNHRQNLGEVSGVITYLWTSLRRRLFDAKRKQSRRKKNNEAVETPRTMKFSAQELMVRGEERTEQSEALKNALEQLSGRRREVLYLKYYEGMSYGEIEQIMDISYHTARNYVYKGLKLLRKYMAEKSTGLVLTAMGVIGFIYTIYFLMILS